MKNNQKTAEKIEIKSPSQYLKMDILAIIQKYKNDDYELTYKICEHIMMRDMGLTLP